MPCRASFLITPRHPPWPAYLLHVLKELRSVLSPLVWDQDWREPSARLRDLR
ncbi:MULTISPECIES: hypothetical protein [unclassified Streptomyces]|uniref:hypothetical protein n=1 Tax=unclassified Streptomyces TaxID=2593676 RepID=UPI002E2B5566|nr:hypothetical protein [Streptomyces sp. NBC_00228]